jgi:hypothetical protein
MEIVNIFDVFNKTLFLKRNKPKDNRRVCYEKYKGVAKNACMLKSQYYLNKTMALKINNLIPQAKGFRFISTNKDFSGQAVGYALKSLRIPIRTEKEVYRVNRSPYAVVDYLKQELSLSALGIDEINVYSNFNGAKDIGIYQLKSALSKMSIPAKTKINVYYVTEDNIEEVNNRKSDIDNLVNEMTEKILKKYL